LLLELLAATKPRGFFPGNADFEVIDPHELARLARTLNLPLIATNLRVGFAENSYLPYLVISVKERRVLLLGLVAAADNEDVRSAVPTIDAVKAANTALQSARAEHERIDLVVGFTDAGIRELGEWRTAGLDVDILVTPPVQGEADGPRWRDGQLLVKSEPLGRAFGRLDVVFGAGKERSVSPQPSLEWAPRHVAAMEQLFLDREPVLQGLMKESVEVPAESVGLDGLPQRDPSKDPDAVRRGLAEAKLSRSRAIAAISEMNLEEHLVVPGLVLVAPALEEDEIVKSRLADFHGANLKRISADLRAGGPAPVDEQYAGQDQCIACHAEEVARWSRGPHARAWLHLTQRGETRTAACLACHTTGFGEPGGFVDASDNDSLLNVQCEACHGPMQLHARQATQVGVRPSSGLPVSRTTCTRCHDAENSPDFTCASYVRAVSHVGGPDEVDASVARVCTPSN
jgi:hypothetical protein